MDKIRVLLVDDHAIIRDGIRALVSLRNEIEIVGEASDGKEAIEKARELNPDVIVMDIAMPGMDGLEATRRITKQNPKAKILVLTQYDSREFILSAIQAGADGYIPKRALGSELTSAILAVYNGDSFLHPSAATALIKDYRQQAQTVDPYGQLTPREREILKLIAEGHKNREIADRLVISLKTVLGHRNRLMRKLGISNQAELFKYAVRKGLLTLDS